MTGTIRDLNPEVHHPMVEALHLSLLACTCSLMMERGWGSLGAPRSQVCVKIKSRMAEVVSGTCAAFGARGTFTPEEDTYPIVDNHPAQTAVVEGLAKKLGFTITAEGLPLLGAEDFSYFLHEKPGAPARLVHTCAFACAARLACAWPRLPPWPHIL